MKHCILLRVVLLSLAILLAPAARAGGQSVVILLKIDGIAGETFFAGHETEILIGSASFGVGQKGALSEASKRGINAAKASFNPVELTKNTDKASPQLFLQSVLGNAIKNATVTFYRLEENELVPFFAIRMEDVLMSSYNVSGSSDDNPEESFTLNYSKIAIVYYPQVGPPIVTGFDLVKNKSFTPSL